MNVSESRRNDVPCLAAKYAGASLAEDVKTVIGPSQLAVTAIIVAISVEDSAAMKAGMFLQDEKKGEEAS